ncbi:RagB/SusD family nutrient uptake outer membrane protein [Sediminitomix flava]|uniref:Putative outer membrane starch-binding protein n=1 Tax=Sediminitomix flava TaxID=379075 RepID=A0A315ZHJ5_SEDFL|nr:RagB/SusD family nutrient uptake outer membrane protein [Sediminitomix flava]PWJ44669.1 putative outer membrane starch-binding protein [Sediminitomix flava]
MKLNRILFGILMLFALNSCEEFLEEDPSRAGGVLPEDVFSSYDKSYAALVGTYDALSHYYFDGLSSVICADVIGDDMLINSEGNYNWFVSTYQLNVLANYNDAYNPWRRGYAVINNANNLIAYAGGIADATEEQINYLTGQAYAVRAYTYLRLVQMYAPAYIADPLAPQGLILRTAPSDSESPDLGRSTVQETYDLILEDLEEAEKLLDYDEFYKGFLDKRTVHALMARTHLLMENWEEASQYAEMAILGSGEEGSEMELMIKEEWVAGFAHQTTESMFVLDYQIEDNNVYLTIPSFYYPAFGYSSVRANDKFVEMFDAADYRRNVLANDLTWDDGSLIDPDKNWMILKFGHDSQVGNAKSTKIRVSEMYLIWAEAEAELGNYNQAQSLVDNVIKRSNSLADRPSVEGEELINLILDERRRELFGEGFRWFDIKRRLQPYKREGDHWVKFDFGPNDADYYRLTFPIPQYEIDANTALTEADQNIGY